MGSARGGDRPTGVPPEHSAVSPVRIPRGRVVLSFVTDGPTSVEPGDRLDLYAPDQLGGVDRVAHDAVVVERSEPDALNAAQLTAAVERSDVDATAAGIAGGGIIVAVLPDR